MTLRSAKKKAKGVNSVEIYLTYREASERYNIPIGTLRWYVHRLMIPHIRWSLGVVRFSASALEAWLAERSVSPITRKSSLAP